MKFFEASIETIIIRYYLMMVAVILPFVIGLPILAITAVPIFLSALMGVSFKWKMKKSINKAFEKSTTAKRYALPKSAAA